MAKYPFISDFFIQMKITKLFLAVWIWVPFCCLGQHHGHHLARLERMNVNRDFITMSGFSSGGTFAQQMYFSYSSLIHGIGVFSHTYYRCGPISNLPRSYDALCTTVGNLRNSELYDPDLALRDIDDYFKSGLIDDPRNMANKPLYVTTGTRNWLFTTDMSLRILQIFEPFINNVNAIKTHITSANHTLPSDRTDLPSCSSPPNPFAVGSCGFSAAFESLQFLLGKHVVQKSEKHLRTQPLISFDQTEFFFGIGGTGRHDMDDVGFMYIPTVCKNPEVQCYVHFYFHGCMTGREFVGADHILNSGFLEVAEENGIIMIFPQVIHTPVENAVGCWDTYGFTGHLYATKQGGQVTVVRNMLARILGEDGMFSTVHKLKQEHPTIPVPTISSFSTIPIPIASQSFYQNTSPRLKQLNSPLIDFAGSAIESSSSGILPRCSRLTCQYSNYYNYAL